jgi:hypothetical protein
VQTAIAQLFMRAALKVHRKLLSNDAVSRGHGDRGKFDVQAAQLEGWLDTAGGGGGVDGMQVVMQSDTSMIDATSGVKA